ncbi:MAG: hypothetical protein C6W59_14020 [Paenibacillaceae bacterium]|nr:MAG: hypothetical protein C6W59_14020 [Paenibacillaceae bacterium]
MNKQTIKCVVWDLDNTIWDGVLLENSDLKLKPGIEDIIKTLDRRGILQSISSKNDHDAAMAALKSFGLDEYFLYPEINWNAKSYSLAQIQKNLNISMDAILFIDDQEYELQEVKSVHSSAHCMNACEYRSLLDDPRLIPRFITEDSAMRRMLYKTDQLRKQAEAEFNGPSEAFLASLNMRMIIAPADEHDLQRAEELTVRTNQLNATGKAYSYEELDRLRQSEDHQLLITELEDRFGTYGKIGLALVHMNETCWRLKMMLMSCRVVSRGVGTVLLTHIMQEAHRAGKPLLADFRDTGRNRMMNITFRFAGFRDKFTEPDGTMVLEHDLRSIPQFPPYIDVVVQQ